MKKFEWIFIFCALTFFTAHGIYSAGVNSVTADEYVHLPVGYSILKTGSVDMDHRGSPPLARAILSIPLLFNNPVLDTSSPAWENGEIYAFSWEFMKNNFEDYAKLFFYPRIVGVVFGLALIICIAVISGRIYGSSAVAPAAVIAAGFPEFLAHSPLVTTDFIGAGFFLSPSSCSHTRLNILQ